MPEISRRHMLVLAPATVVLQLQLALLTTGSASAGPAAEGGAGGPITPPPEVQAAIDKVLEKIITKAKAPVALRLAYHDAATFDAEKLDGGINASIRFELDRPENFGLNRGWRLIETAMADLQRTPAAGRVSHADLIALAGAAAVAVCGGPVIDGIGTGRVDATAADPAGRMVSEASSAEQLKANFAAKGFSVRELVALSGAHTLGGKGFGDPVTFDNAYYTALMARPWNNTADPMASMIGLPSDHALPEDAECLEVIKEYAADTSAFFRDFSKAYRKMVGTGARWSV